ncbi:MAG: hypothetical protein Q9187_007407, partial [Circinaria calcarea]
MILSKAIRLTQERVMGQSRNNDTDIHIKYGAWTAVAKAQMARKLKVSKTDYTSGDKKKLRAAAFKPFNFISSSIPAKRHSNEVEKPEASDTTIVEPPTTLMDRGGKEETARKGGYESLNFPEPVESQPQVKETEIENLDANDF